MKRRLRRLAIIALILGGLYGGYKWHKVETKGFALWKVTPIDLDQSWFSDLANASALQEVYTRKEIDQLLSQKFFYMNRGGQSFVFLGEDGETVLKIYSTYLYKFFNFLSHIPLGLSLHKSLADRWDRVNVGTRRLYRSCFLAAQEIPTITQILYLHLFTTDNIQKKITLIDRLGFAHQIDADRAQYFLQKRVVVSDDLCKNAIAKENQMEYISLLERMEKIAFIRYEKGVSDRDFVFHKNVGFAEGQAVLLDFGSIAKEESKKELALKVREELRRFEKNLLTSYPEARSWTESFFRENPFHLSFCSQLELEAEDQYVE